MRREVESLLAHDAAASEEGGDRPFSPAALGKAFMAASAKAVQGLEGVLAPMPSQIGPYKILDVLGEGGFGVVYLAEQSEPIRRRVALKVLKPGMDSARVLARFEAERQALALMDHANIAKVLDAGATPDGRPYFVMEHVPGEAVTRYCDRLNLKTRDRLEIFVQVCEAVQHAHTKGVIHRDIKPTNVLVTASGDRPVPKVIDFGVAKAINQRLAEETVFTEVGQIVGTPEYMSPEQAEMGALDVDSRTDVYSLGVLLYELLTGTLPFDSKELRAAGFGEIQRIIREVEPPRPSTRLSSLGEGHAGEVAKRRQTRAANLARELARELEWIPLKAMRKDRTRRYRTAAEMADDIRNYLEGKALIAGPESAGYRLAKAIRRHKVAVGAGAAVFVSLAAGLAVTYTALQVAKENRRLADKEALRASGAEQAAKSERDEAIAARARAEASARFVRDLILAPGEQGSEIKVRDLLKHAPALIDSEYADDRATRSSLYRSLAECYRVLELPAEAEQRATDAVRLAVAANGEKSHAACDANITLADIHLIRGRFDDATRLFEQTLAIRRALPGENRAAVLSDLSDFGASLLASGRPAQAETILREALAMDDAAAARSPTRYQILANLGRAVMRTGNLKEARPFLDEALRLVREVKGESHRHTAMATSDLGLWHFRSGDGAKAEAHFREAKDILQRLYGPDHSAVLNEENSIGLALTMQNKIEDALRVHTANREALQARLGPAHPRTIVSATSLADVQRRMGRLDESVATLREAIESGLPDDALSAGDSETVVRVLNVLGNALLQKEDYQGAVWALRRAVRIWERLGQGETAAGLVDKRNLAGVLVRMGEPAEAERIARPAAEATEKLFGPANLNTPEALRIVGAALVAQKTEEKAREAEPILRRAIALCAEIKLPPAEAWRASRLESTLAECLITLKQFEEAERLGVASYESLRAARGDAFLDTRAALRRVVWLYEAWGRPEKAAEWRAKEAGK